ncbi:MAG: hypothetical protein ACE5MI_01155 [Acidimicrobiia bacterium]
MTSEGPGPDVVYVGEVVPRESEGRRLVRAGARVLVTTFDIGFLLLGTALLGLAVTVLLDGFGVIEVGLVSSAGETLGSALVVAVLGAFGLGVAAEGPIYRGVRGVRISFFEHAVLRAVSLLLVGSGLVLLGRFLDRLTSDLPAPFDVVTEFVATVGFAGLSATALIGVLGVWAIQRLAPNELWVELELPILYFVWALSAALVFTL